MHDFSIPDLKWRRARPAQIGLEYRVGIVRNGEVGIQRDSPR
ncbi:MAG TPA: hypothetical protein VGY48_34785 [Vicinamibacterales bacterium]|nr:hypothetical protein [Vicinamibacterales bacterium]